MRNCKFSLWRQSKFNSSGIWRRVQGELQYPKAGAIKLRSNLTLNKRKDGISSRHEPHSRDHRCPSTWSYRGQLRLSSISNCQSCNYVSYTVSNRTSNTDKCEICSQEQSRHTSRYSVNFLNAPHRLAWWQATQRPPLIHSTKGGSSSASARCTVVTRSMTSSFNVLNKGAQSGFLRFADTSLVTKTTFNVRR